MPSARGETRVSHGVKDAAAPNVKRASEGKTCRMPMRGPGSDAAKRKSPQRKKKRARVPASRRNASAAPQAHAASQTIGDFTRTVTTW
jgi:hypothetical protein